MTNVIWLQLFVVFWALFSGQLSHWVDIPVMLVLSFGSAMLAEGIIWKWKAKPLGLLPSQVWQAPLSKWEHLLFGVAGIAMFLLLWSLYRQMVYPLLGYLRR